MSGMWSKRLYLRMKVVINKCYGGFGLSKEGMMYINKQKKLNGLKPCAYAGDLERNDPLLVETVEKLGVKANDNYSKLKVVDIPDDVYWEIEDYDGLECVRECSRSWE
jgi:hypothetical protein